ncbi:hypothetical protein FHR81_000837 [Actinoalloteichus hoggarensis]|uniref:Uncharacterized protein n=1 Tax=Actinoalloteichus hoggarensis TaxID=1470176 RepID=A0A221W121_9PSEU|nr:hypothetical protein [Actinoalloteichus hoggarensis]ASO19486.1 hypothetical protein AHOG_09210 [Actinoalloteichus hoggarensis]MBB5919808.1 hypothetical protein [Actinoalloteichus hoggarensis]
MESAPLDAELTWRDAESLVFPHHDIAVGHTRQRPAADEALVAVDETSREGIVVCVVSSGARGWRITVGRHTMVA